MSPAASPPTRGARIAGKKVLNVSDKHDPTTPTVLLTRPEQEVAELLVACLTAREIAAAREGSWYTIRDHIREIGRKLGCPGNSRPVLLHALLCGGHVDTPRPSLPAPAFTRRDLLLLRALAECNDEDGIAEAADIARDTLESQVNALIYRAGGKSCEHLIVLAHGWGLLGSPQTTVSSSTRRMPRSTRRLTTAAGQPADGPMTFGSAL